MATVNYISLILCLAMATFCNSVDICGLESIRKCHLNDAECLEELEKALRSWFQSPAADGYYVIPVDPLNLQQLDFDAGAKKIILNNVSIKGIAHSNISIDLMDPHILEVTYYLNIELNAKNYVVKNHTDEGSELLEYDNPVTIAFHEVTIITNVTCVKKERCTGSTHAFLRPQKLYFEDGRAIIQGLDLKILKVDRNDFDEDLIEKVGKLSTDAIYKAQQQVTSIVPYNALFIDNVEN